LRFLDIERLNCELQASVGVYNYVDWEDNKGKASHWGRVIASPFLPCGAPLPVVTVKGEHTLVTIGDYEALSGQ